MATKQPDTTLDTRYSSPGATETAWTDVIPLVEAAEIFWVTTLRPDGRPHITPLIAVWVEDALHFTTGSTERKARNLASNAHCALTTGCNRLNEEGMDVVVEGSAIRLTDTAELQRVADAFVAKYGEAWRFTVRDGAFWHTENAGGGAALVYRVVPETAYGFGKGATYSQTRWTF